MFTINGELLLCIQKIFENRNHQLIFNYYFIAKKKSSILIIVKPPESH